MDNYKCIKKGFINDTCGSLFNGCRGFIFNFQEERKIISKIKHIALKN
jgi:hypothetical protein